MSYKLKCLIEKINIKIKKYICIRVLIDRYVYKNRLEYATSTARVKA